MRKLLLLAILLATPILAWSQAPGQFVLRMEVVRAGFTFQNMTADEAKVLTQHGAYLKSLYDQGTLTYAGQIFDPKGLWGVVVVNAPNADAAAAILAADPGVKGGVFRGDVYPFRAVFK